MLLLNLNHDSGKGIDSSVGEMRNAYNILVGKCEGKRPLGLGIIGKIM
jgi:hypothetical protein